MLVRPLNPLRRLVLAAALLLGAAAPAALAQNVTGQAGISFGTVYRATGRSISYSSSDAARFQVVGRHSRNIRIIVTVTSLARIGGGTATLVVGNSDCAFSRDGGATWTTFSSGSLYQNTTLPSGNGNGNTTLMVRVGGTISSGFTGTRGTYNGTVTVTATYL